MRVTGAGGREAPPRPPWGAARGRWAPGAASLGEGRWARPSLPERVLLVSRVGSVVAYFTSAKFLLYLGHALSTWVSKVLA